MHQIDMGYGKIILLGEHLVVHGHKALVATLPFKTYATAKITGDSCVLIDQRPKVPTYKKTNKTLLYQNMVTKIAQQVGIQDNLEVVLEGDLPVTSGGIGASAAACVAVAKALCRMRGAKPSTEELNKLAFHGECCIHGSPSGIDNTAALYGGIFLYDKIKGRSVLQVSEPLYLVIADSGCVSDTFLAIAGLKDRMATDMHILSVLFRQYERLVPHAGRAVQEADWKMLGQLMLENHDILRELDLSSALLDSMVDLAMQEGALGAKLSGSGKGGIMIVLVEGQKEQQKIQKAFDLRGFWTLAVRLDYATKDANQVL